VKNTDSKLDSHFLLLVVAQYSEVHALPWLIHERDDVLPVFLEVHQYLHIVLCCQIPLEELAGQGHWEVTPVISNQKESPAILWHLQGVKHGFYKIININTTFLKCSQLHNCLKPNCNHIYHKVQHLRFCILPIKWICVLLEVAISLTALNGWSV